DRGIQLLLADALPPGRALDPDEPGHGDDARLVERRLHDAPATAARGAALPRAVAAREPDHARPELHGARGRRLRSLRRHGALHAEPRPRRPAVWQAGVSGR